MRPKVPRDHHHAQLEYTLEHLHGELVYSYRPFGERLVVDGITYLGSDGFVDAPMLSLVPAISESGRANMWHSRPPTDQELDQWVAGARPHLQPDHKG
jgi:hypothetical protein